MGTGEITANTRVPFGRKPDKGKKLCECSDSFLRWMVSMLWDTDRHAWAFQAKEVLAAREAGGKQFRREDSLDAQADAFLRNRGYGDLARRH